MQEAQAEQVVRQIVDPVVNSAEADAFLEGQKTQELAKSRLAAHQPEQVDNFNAIMLSFMWEEVSLSTTKKDLQTLLEHDSVLVDKFATFLNAPLETAQQQDEARAALCKIYGLPATVSRAAIKKPINEAEYSALMNDIEARWAEEPKKFESFFTLAMKYGFGEKKEETRMELIELLAEEPDLAARFKEVVPALQEGGKL